MQILKTKKESKFGSFNISIFHRKVGEATNVEVFDRTRVKDVIDDVQWSLNTDVYSDNEYLTITGINYYLWVFKSTAFEFVYELPQDKLPLQDMCNEKLPELIRKLLDFEEHQLYTDELYDDSEAWGTLALIGDKDRWILPLGKDDFHFIRTK